MSQTVNKAVVTKTKVFSLQNELQCTRAMMPSKNPHPNFTFQWKITPRPAPPQAPHETGNKFRCSS